MMTISNYVYDKVNIVILIYEGPLDHFTTQYAFE